MKRAWPVALALMIFAAAIPSNPAAAQSGVIQIVPELVGPGTKVTVLIADGGLDANPNRIDEYEAEDVELVTIATDRGEVGEAVPDLEETGENTSVFRLTFKTSLQVQGNAILVNMYNDEAIVEYTDEFPADFTTTTTEKIFGYYIGIAHGDPGPSFGSSVPGIITNNTPAVGKQMELSFVATSDADYTQPFVGLIEVRDHNGATVFLAWQGGILEPQSQIQIGVSWTPDRPGDYTARTFLISDFESPDVLSFVAESDFTIE